VVVFGQFNHVFHHKNGLSHFHHVHCIFEVLWYVNLWDDVSLILTSSHFDIWPILTQSEVTIRHLTHSALRAQRKKLPNGQKEHFNIRRKYGSNSPYDLTCSNRVFLLQLKIRIVKCNSAAVDNHF